MLLATALLLFATPDLDEAACRAAAADVSETDARALTIAMLDVLKDGTTTARACAAAALAKSAPLAASDPAIAKRLKDEAVPVLVLGLDQRGEMCTAAADALGSLGSIASDAVPRLEEKLANESCSQQSLHAEAALQRIKTGG